MQKLTIAEVQKMNGIIPPKTSGAIEKRQKWDVRDNVMIELLLSQHSPKSIINKIYRLIEQKSSNYVSFEKARTTKLKIESIELREEDICQN